MIVKWNRLKKPCAQFISLEDFSLKAKRRKISPMEGRGQVLLLGAALVNFPHK